MENKKTTELLDLIDKLEKTDEKNGLSEEEYTEMDGAIVELRKRSPFRQIMGTEDEVRDDESSLYLGQKQNREDIKLIKRHKHDNKSGDVLIRI